MILVTGATGYIGSHMSLSLIERGYKIVMVDDFSNSSHSTFLDLYKFATDNDKPLPIFRRIDVLHENLGSSHFNDGINTIFHFAGLKSLSESFLNPTGYFHTNSGGTASVLNTYANCKEFIFSSSAAVYAPSTSGIFTEDSLLGPLSPYGKSKLMAESIVVEHSKCKEDFKFANLRYFNPAGANPSGLLRENPKGTPNNLIPYLAKVALGDLPELSIYGSDYPTKDGTAIRDYIHVMDVIEGHLLAWEYLKSTSSITLNLGSGVGLSVKEMAECYSLASGRKIPTVVRPPRRGDVPVLLADYTKARTILGWTPKYSSFDMCKDSWKSVMNLRNC